jgi:hypothetical protein
VAEKLIWLILSIKMFSNGWRAHLSYGEHVHAMVTRRFCDKREKCSQTHFCKQLRHVIFFEKVAKFVGKLAYTCTSSSKIAQCKPSPNWRKLSYSSHPVSDDDYAKIATNLTYLLKAIDTDLLPVTTSSGKCY